MGNFQVREAPEYMLQDDVDRTFADLIGETISGFVKPGLNRYARRLQPTCTAGPILAPRRRCLSTANASSSWPAAILT
jgi:hypothetical protein